MHGSGAQGRSLGWRQKLRNHQLHMIFKVLRLAKSTRKWMYMEKRRDRDPRPGILQHLEIKKKRFCYEIPMKSSPSRDGAPEAKKSKEEEVSKSDKCC